MTLKEARDFIVAYMRNPHIPETMLDVWIGDAIVRIETEADWAWLTDSATITATRAAPLSGYTLVPGAQKILSVAFIDDSLGSTLENLSWKQGFDRFPDITASSVKPAYYTAIADLNDDNEPVVGIRLWPPSSTDTTENVLVRYRRQLTKFPVDTNGTINENQKIPLPVELHPAIRNFALAEALQSEGRTEDASAQLNRYRQAVDRARPRLVSANAEGFTIGENRLGV